MSRDIFVLVLQFVACFCIFPPHGNIQQSFSILHHGLFAAFFRLALFRPHRRLSFLRKGFEIHPDGPNPLTPLDYLLVAHCYLSEDLETSFHVGST